MSIDPTVNSYNEFPSARVELKVTPHGQNGSADVVCHHGDQVIHRDRITPAKAIDRRKYAQALINRLGDRSGIDFDSLDAELSSIADTLDRQRMDADSKGATDGEISEIPTSAVVRPELIIREDASAIAIPILTQSDANALGEWKLYTRRQDRRECSPLTDRLMLPDDETLWMSPLPAAPSVKDVADFGRWSLKSRQAWLDGAPAPTTGDVLQMVADRIDRYIVLPHGNTIEHRLTLAAWVMMTYIYPGLSAVPYVFLAGPANSGKTRAMDVLKRMVYRPLMAGNVTAASIFRTRHAYGGVMLLDEAERMGESRSPDVAELRSILLSGYRRGGRVIRMEPFGDTFRTVSFDCFGPVVLGAIHGLPPALASRCITVRMSRAMKHDPQSRRSLDDTPEQATAVLDALHCWALEYGYQAINTCLPRSSLANRDAELWEPLIRIISHAGDLDTIRRFVSHAKRMSKIAAEDATPQGDPVLLRALCDLRNQSKQPRAGEVLRYAKVIDPDVIDEVWTAKGVAGVLRRYDIRTKKTNGNRVYRIQSSQIEAIAKRYGFDIGNDD
jgi:hypothetical protein